MPQFYVSPERIMEDKANYALQGIAKSKDVVALEYADGIVFVTENLSATLNKIYEIYDRIALAAVGMYPEVEPLRTAGIYQCEIKGFAYSREDVNAKWLATFYSQQIGSVFRQIEAKPLEVELLLAEVGDTPDENRIFHISFDGSVWDEPKVASIGGHSEEIKGFVKGRYEEGLPLEVAIKLAVNGLESIEEGKKLTFDKLEVAVLDRNRERRKFRRISKEKVAEILS
jgi:proteasome alpha subunit